ncbi:MAG: hypothetical protein AAGC64_12965 [Bacteroidota bacterium]
MRKIIYVLFGVLLVNGSCSQEKSRQTKANDQEIRIDSVVTYLQDEKKYAKVYYDGKSEIHPLILLTKPNKGEVVIKNNMFKVDQLRGGNFGSQIIETFKYSYEIGKFELIKQTFIYRDADEGVLAPEIEVDFSSNYKQNYDISTLNNMLETISSNYKNGLCETNYEITMIAEMLELLGITKDNVTKFNDLGYYIQLCGDSYTACYLFNEILKKYPSRIVTYLNLADAYWQLENEKASKLLYKKYINKMTEKGLEMKIPSHVYERTN